MKKFLLIFFLSFTQLAIAQKIFDKPNPPKAINDFGHMLEPFQVEALERKVEAYNDSTSSAIVIITVEDLGDYAIEDVALKYLRDWGVGTKETNNGVVILVSKNQRKASIQTGYGMEGVLPDITCKQIIDDRMIPYFKENDFYRGFDNAIDAIIQAAAGEYKTVPRQNARGSGRGSFKGIFILILIVLFILSRIGGGGGGGNYMSRRGSRGFGGALPWFIAGNILGGGGRGGGFGGGGGGFGGGGGGGFGGFGGGSGGGGGASGGW